MVKKIGLGAAVGLFVLTAFAATAHATAGPTPHSLTQCIACGLCELLHDMIHG